MSQTKTLQEKVAEEIEKLGLKVQEKVIELKVQKELDMRVQDVLRAVRQLEAMQAKIAGFKPDVKTFSTSGEELPATFSENVWNDKQKAIEEAEKLEEALNGALENADFEALNKVLDKY